MRSIVGAQIDRAFAALGDFQAKDFGREGFRRGEVGRAKANVANVPELDQRRLLHSSGEFGRVVGAAAPGAKRLRGERELARRARDLSRRAVAVT